MRPLRIATVPYVNAAPLIWGLREARDPGVRLVAEPPARIADLLLQDQVDVGLLPVIEIQRHDGLEILPGLCVASRRLARSVFLASPRPIEEARRIAVDWSSRTSAALLRVLLAHRRLTQVSFTECRPDLPAMLRDHDAALLIGDAALQADTHGLSRYDLAEEWFGMTGLPFVFAVWAVRAGTDLADGAPRFAASCRDGLQHLGAIAAREGERLGLPASTIEEYLRVNIHYELGEEELRGLELFFRRAHDLALVGAPRPIVIRAADTAASVALPGRPA
jgi:chorismate dehydratase